MRPALSCAAPANPARYQRHRPEETRSTKKRRVTKSAGSQKRRVTSCKSAGSRLAFCLLQLALRPTNNSAHPRYRQPYRAGDSSEAMLPASRSRHHTCIAIFVSIKIMSNLLYHRIAAHRVKSSYIAKSIGQYQLTTRKINNAMRVNID